MATTGADTGARVARAAALAAALVLLSCAPLERGGPIALVPPESGTPRVRVGLVVGEPALTIGGGAALRVTRPDGTPVATVPAGRTATVHRAAQGFQLQVGGVTLPVMDGAVVAVEDTGFVRVGGRDYRGMLDLAIGSAGLVAANRITVEDYLLGVVNAEMGRRGSNELEALRAQAVVSRTVAVRAIGRFPERGYDLLPTVADQAYLGVAGELPQGHDAVTATRGIVLLYDGAPIDAFFHSTCGGRTAEPTEIFVGAGGRPYLRSVADQALGGGDYCAISPRHRWREEWTGGGLAATLRETVPAGAGGSGAIGRLRSVEVTRRGATGRVMAIAVSHAAGTRTIEGANAVRTALRPAGGGMLRSSHFTLRGDRSGPDLARLVAEGQGAGHGVGMCQWGAVGRARGGAGWHEIVTAYFPGATIGRLY